MADEVADAGVSWTLIGGSVTMEILPREQRDLRVRFVDKSDDVLWSAIYDRGFWESRTKKGEIKNKLADNTPYADDEIKKSLEKVWTDLTENAEDYQEDLVSPSVEQLIENTERVETFDGDEREIHVWVKGQPYGTPADGAEADGGTEVRKLIFSNSEWIRKDGDTQVPPVVEKYSNAFFEVLDISWQEWRDDIRARWQEMQRFHSGEQMTTPERIALLVTRALRNRVDAHADETKVINDTWNGWFTEDTQHGEVLWVPGDTLDEAMDKFDKGIDYRPQLSRALKNQGFTVATRKQTTINGERVELYPFLPKEVGIEEPSVDVIGYEDDDDDDDGEASGDIGDGDGGDGGDSGGDSATDSESDDAPPTPPEPTADESDDGVDPGGEILGEVAEVIRSKVGAGASLNEATLAAEAATDRDIAPPEEVREAIERGVIEGVLYRPDDEEGIVALRPGGVKADSPDGVVDPTEEGVPEA